MWRIVLVSQLLLGLCLAAAQADPTVKELQVRLKKAGFYQGEADGQYNSETAAAVTRFQIREGLAITGQMDAATLHALNVSQSTGPGVAAPSPDAATWRRLRDEDAEFLKKLNAGEIAPPNASPSAAAEAASESGTPSRRVPQPQPEGSVVPEAVVASPGTTAAPGIANQETERLRDYVGAFILAGLDPHVGAELEFFAARVNYFGAPNVSRERILRDLIAYDKRWPQRSFFLSGDPVTTRKPDGTLEVTFSLRYQLRNGRKTASGQVRKTITLRRSSTGALEIAGVNERKE
jgi:peptidoglycan hydrolase-like protein with peptidoglycan-binding domain